MGKKELRGKSTWRAVPRLSIGAVLVLVAVFALACGRSDIVTGGQALETPGVETIAVANGDGHEGTEVAGLVDEHGDGDDHEGTEVAALVDEHGDGDDHEGTEVAALVDEHGDGNGAEANHQDDHDGEAGDLLEVTVNVVEGRTWGYEPATLEVPAGQRVRLTYVNGGQAEHDLEIPGLPASNVEREGVAHDVSLTGGDHDDDVVAAHAMPGTTAVVLFTPTQPGEYEFNCTLPGHKEAGMVGRIIVVP
jgi:uncharacterized cupredoxin-like copper-binding protein